MLVRADVVLPGGGEDPITRGAVRIEEGAIVAVGTRRTLPRRRGEECHDLPGRTLLPGLVDAHDHLMGARPDLAQDGPPQRDMAAAIVAAQESVRHLERGVTSVRVLGAAGGVDLALRAAVDGGLADGPRLQCAGRAITARRDESTIALGVRGAAGARAAVRDQVAAGADVIKLFASGGIVALSAGFDPGRAGLTAAELLAATRAAHEAGCRVATHAIGETAIEAALAAGTDSIEHGIGLTQEQAVRMARDGTVLVPTVSTYRRLATLGDVMGVPSTWIRAAHSLLDAHDEAVRSAIRAGVIVAVGTDGFGSIVDEIAALADLGLGPLDAIDAACRGGSLALDRGDRAGLLRPGFVADLTVVWGRPHVTTAALADVDAVFQAGRLRRSGGMGGSPGHQAGG